MSTIRNYKGQNDIALKKVALHLLDSKYAQKSIWTQIHCRFTEVFDQAFINSTHKIAYSYWARSSEVLRDSLFKKLGQ